MGGAGPGHADHRLQRGQFAVRGFTEALIEDLRSNAPQVRVAVLMPGHVGTDIIGNTLRAHGKDPEQMTEAQLKAMIPVDARAGLPRRACCPRTPPPRICAGC